MQSKKSWKRFPHPGQGRFLSLEAKNWTNVQQKGPQRTCIPCLHQYIQPKHSLDTPLPNTMILKTHTFTYTSNLKTRKPGFLTFTNLTTHLTTASLQGATPFGWSPQKLFLLTDTAAILSFSATSPILHKSVCIQNLSRHFTPCRLQHNQWSIWYV